MKCNRVNLVICDSFRYVKLYTCLITHSFYMTQPFTFLPSIILMISSDRYNLLSYTSCSFLQFAITFSHKILRTGKHCSQTQSTVYSQHHRTSVTHTFMKIICKHTHTHTHTGIYQWTWVSESRKGGQNIM